jgi:hypothetical protein
MDFYATICEKVKIFLSFHSATQALLYPWGDTASPAPNVADLVRTPKITPKNHKHNPKRLKNNPKKSSSVQ